jgi:hypothetical protein
MSALPPKADIAEGETAPLMRFGAAHSRGMAYPGEPSRK